MATRHRIRSLDFDLTFASGGMAMSQGEPLRTLVVDQLLPVVASVFDEATDDGAAADIYRIDRLDVDLGEVYAEDLPEMLAERLAQALAGVLVMRRDQGAATDGATEHGGAGEDVGRVGVGGAAIGRGDRDSAGGQRQPDGADAAVQSQAASRPYASMFATAAAADAADLVAFLASGQWVRPGSVPASMQAERDHALRRDEDSRRETDAVAVDGIEALFARVLAGDIQTVRQQIRASASPDMLIQRLTKQFPANGVEALLRALRPAEASGWLQQLVALDHLLASVGWNVAQRTKAQTAARARLLTMGLFPPDAGLREMPWHGIWQAVLSIAQVQGAARDAFDFIAKVRELQRGDEARAGAMDAARTGEVSQAGSARSPMIDALHRIAETRANGAVDEDGTATRRPEGAVSTAVGRSDAMVNVSLDAHSSETPDADSSTTSNAPPSKTPDATPSAIHGERSGGLPHAPVPTTSASPPSLTHAGLRALLATSLMRAQAKALYGVWTTLVANEADTLREALRRYLSVPDLREQIALTFPVSMLEDVLTLLLTERPEATQGSTQVRRIRADEYGVATRSQRTAHDFNRTWAWRNAWSHDVAAILGIAGSDVMYGTGFRDEAQRDAPVPAASFDLRVESDAAAPTLGANRLVGDDHHVDDGLLPMTGEADTTGLAHRRIDNAATPSESAATPSIDDVEAHAEVTSRHDRLIRALLSGSAVGLHEDWPDWIGGERASLASVWRHYATYDTVLMRVVEGFPEAMLADLATVTVPSAAAVWAALAELSVGRLVDAEQASALAIEHLPGDTSLTLESLPSLADTKGHEAHSEPTTRYVPSQTEFDQWKREIWHALFAQLRAVSPVASISSELFAALEAIALSRYPAAWTRRALDLWRATVTTASAASPGISTNSLRMADSIEADGNVHRPQKLSIADAQASAPAADTLARHTSTMAIQRLIQHRQRVNPLGGELIGRASSLSDAERVDLRQIVAEISLARGSDLVGIAAHHWQAVVDTMIAVSETIPDAHREVLYRSILDNAPEVDAGFLPDNAAERYYASVAAALANDAVLDLDLFAESAMLKIAPFSPDGSDLDSRETPASSQLPEHRESAERTGPRDLLGARAPRHPDDQINSPDSSDSSDSNDPPDQFDRLNTPVSFPSTSPSRPPAMPEDFIAYLTSTDFRQGRTPPAGFDIWLRQSVYSGAHSLRPIIATAAEDEALAERWLDLVPQPLWPGIARLSSRDTPQVAQMLRVASDVTDLFATTVETVAPASLHRARWRFLFPWLFMPQRPFNPTTFATSLVAQLARHANVDVPPALASRVQQQTGIDMRASDVTDNAHLLLTPLMVPYAGMVLTWPFTSHLWDKLGLTKEHRFVSDEAAERAVLLLHYVGSGSTEAPEPHLTMHKLLCGLPFDTPVARHLDITQDESEICDQMLDVIIQHWSALGNTSRDGLRGSFLQREGRLSMAEDGWHLKVRRAPYDMLLDRLPWSISTIRLSWMEQALWVEWA